MGGGQILPSAQQQPPLPPDEPPLLWSLPEELRLSHLIDRIIGVLQDMELVVDDLALRHPLFNAFPNGSHMSTHAAAILFLCRLTSWVRKNSSSVSFFRSRPNHSGSPVSRLHTTV